MLDRRTCFEETDNGDRPISHCGRASQDNRNPRFAHRAIRGTKKAIHEGDRRRAIALEFEIKELLREKKKIKRWAAA